MVLIENDYVSHATVGSEQPVAVIDRQPYKPLEPAIGTVLDHRIFTGIDVDNEDGPDLAVGDIDKVFGVDRDPIGSRPTASAA